MKRFLILLLLFSGCETIIDIDIPEDEPRLVLNGFINPDSTLSISLFQSMGILETGEFRAVEAANVTVYDKDGVRIADLTDSGSGRYMSAFIPEVGQEYRIEASKSNFATVESSDMIPSDSAEVISINLNLTESGFEGGGSGEYDIDFTIRDYAGTDFYEVQVFERSVYEFDGQRYENFGNRFLESEDPVFDEFNSSGLGLLFGDALFDEGELKITVSTYLNLGNNCDEVPECLSEESFLIVRKVSESYFRYNRTLRLQQDLEGNPFAEPVSVFNNIKNGFGIFAGYRNSTFLLEVPENQ